MEVKPKAVTARGTPVYCAFDELVDVAALVPNPRNPNQHPERQIRATRVRKRGRSRCVKRCAG
jgi:hypothetical protein